MGGSEALTRVPLKLRALLVTAAFLGAALWYIASQVSFHEAAEAVRQANPWLLLGCVGLKSLAFVMRSVRWATAIEGATSVRPRKRVVASAVIGYAMNLILPARLGDFARAEVMDRHNKTSKTIALTSFWLCSVIDYLVLATLLLALSFLGGLAGLVDQRLVVLTLLVGMVILAALYFFGGLRDGATFAAWLRRLPQQAFIERVSRRSGQALGLLRSKRALAAVIAWSLAVWAAEIGGTYWAMRAFQIDVGLTSAAVVTAALSLSFVVPLTPGNVGTHQVICLLVLGVWGVAEARALMFSVGMQGSVSLTVIAAGLIFALQEGLANVMPSRRAQPGEPSSIERESTDADSRSDRIRILGTEARSEL